MYSAIFPLTKIALGGTPFDLRGYYGTVSRQVIHVMMAEYEYNDNRQEQLGEEDAESCPATWRGED